MECDPYRLDFPAARYMKLLLGCAALTLVNAGLSVMYFSEHFLGAATVTPLLSYLALIAHKLYTARRVPMLVLEHLSAMVLLFSYDRYDEPIVMNLNDAIHSTSIDRFRHTPRLRRHIARRNAIQWIENIISDLP